MFKRFRPATTMRARFFLPALFLLSLWLPGPRAWAQGRPLGPWRLTYQLRDAWVHGTDTIAKELIQGCVHDWTYHEVEWDVEPDSIRLFLNCENPLIAPALPRKGQPPIRFTAAGATVRLDAKSRQLLLAPSAANVTLWAYRGKTMVFAHVFTAIPLPLPVIEVHLFDDTHTIYEHRPTTPRTRFTLAVKARSADGVSQLMPEDGRYRVSRYQLTILRNNKPIEPTRTLKSGLEIPLDSAQSGDIVKIDVQQVQRKNFRGVITDIPYIKHFMVELL